MKKFYILVIALFSVASYAQTVTATIGYQGYEETQEYFGQGEYEIFLDNVDGILDKPILILDGFDPGDARDIPTLYSILDFVGGNLADILRDQGYDIVIMNSPLYNTDGLDIDGGSDYIQRNAMVFAELIQLINAQKVGSEELVVIGPSMGGLIARYALSYMEQNSLTHDTRLFISFDAPHLGANIPISFQYLLNYFAKGEGEADAQAILDSMLNTPAAKEMLVDHYLGHLAAGSEFEQDPSLLLPVGAPNFREAFQTELDDLGFPNDVRNVSMINGSGSSMMTGTPGATIISTTLDLGSFITVDIDLKFTPDAGQSDLITGFQSYFVGIPVNTFNAEAESPAESAGFDSAPGGTSELSGDLESDNPIIIALLAALEQDSFSFVPTLSSLAIDNESDWYASPDIGGIHNSPFVNTYIPDDNQLHLTLNEFNIEFALEEILGGVIGVEDFAYNNKYILAENPVWENIHLKLNPSLNYENVNISVYNTSGQLVLSEKLQNPSEVIVLNHNLRSGMYILNIS
ncbi:MAG: T9SS type A sorting domain-containing protein, partial [Flavobacteriaceae bacterium]|nr:T9SS type A sorting domain-containing protein [Flavobacteriaceae bacterium]